MTVIRTWLLSRTWLHGNARGYQFDTGHVAYDDTRGRTYQAKGGKRTLNPGTGSGRKLCPAMDAAIAAYHASPVAS